MQFNIMKRFVFYIALLMTVVACSKKEKLIIDPFIYTIPQLNTEEIMEYVDKSGEQFMFFYVYDFCPCSKNYLPNFLEFTNEHNIPSCILFIVRATDEPAIQYMYNEIQSVDSTYKNIVILSDSMYHEKIRHRKQRGPIQYTGGDEDSKLETFLHDLGYPNDGEPQGWEKLFSRYYTKNSSGKKFLFQAGRGCVYYFRAHDGTELQEVDKDSILHIISQQK